MLKRLFWQIDLFAASLSLAVVVGSVVWGVLTRYLFSQPATWTTELSAIAFAWTVFFGGSAAMRRGLLISIPLVTDLCPAPLRKAIAIRVAALVLAFLAYTTYLATVLAFQAGSRPSPVLRISFFYVYAGIATALAMTTLHALVQLAAICRSAEGRVDFEAAGADRILP